MIDGYEFLGEVGRGRMGTVYRARQTLLDREVAVKVLHEELTARPGVVERFQREARNVAKLNHPHIVLGIDTGVAKGQYYFVMEFLDGGTLGQLVTRQGPLPEEAGLIFLEQATLALAHAATLPLIHRDVKPDNIMLDAHGNLKLTDLGIAQIALGGLEEEEKSGVVLGTPQYIAPEQLRGLRPLDARLDIYALGATFCHLFSGAPPFRGSSAKEIALARLRTPPPDPRELGAEIGEPLARLLQEMMAIDREKRIPSAEALHQRIVELQEAQGLRRPSIRRRATRTATSQDSASTRRTPRSSVLRPPAPARAKDSAARVPVSRRRPKGAAAGRRKIWLAIGGLALLALLVLAYAIWGT